MLGWRLYYSDGSTFSWRDGTWDEAPDDDVQVLVVYDDERNKTLHSGVDHYSIPDEPTVKTGRWMDDVAFYALQDRALRSTPEEA